MNEPSGLLLLDKPSGMTSRAVLNEFERRSRVRHVGHAGTLDPAATGLLIAVLGRARRLVSLVQQMRKHYRATVQFGVRSLSHDADTPLQAAGDASGLTRDAIESAARAFVGEIQQTPPEFSAVKVGGRRAHELARAGESMTLRPRPVTVYRLDCLACDPRPTATPAAVAGPLPTAQFDVECSSGTYVRSLARDLGARLGVGAVLVALVRTQVGPFRLCDALPLDAIDRGSVWRHLLPMRSAATELPQYVVSARELQDVLHGRGLTLPAARAVPAGCLVAILDDADLVAVGRCDDRGQLHPETVLAAPR
jgi:tRNA pseudouridine55 synthase